MEKPDPKATDWPLRGDPRGCEYYGAWGFGHAGANFEDIPSPNPNKVPAGFWPQGEKKPKTLRARKKKGAA